MITRVLLLAVAALLQVATLAPAATITVLDTQEPALIFVQGRLVRGDDDQFRAKVGAISKGIVVFESDGGNVVAGIMIGEAIRLKNFATFVPSKTRCASACAIAWLGGTMRFMGPGAQIGFHAAYNSVTGEETGVGNALVGAYLTRIGLPYSAVLYITQASPSSMTW